MATGTVIFRPATDISLGHSCNSGSSGYILVNESIADDDSTYIYSETSSSVSATTKTSSFTMRAENSLPIGAKLISATVYITSINSGVTGTCSIIGTLTIGTSPHLLSSITPDTSYTQKNQTFTLNNLSKDSTVSLSITSSGKKSSTKDDNGQIRITQIYVEITYTYIESTGVGAYLKTNNEYAEVHGIRKKQNGSWINITKTDIDTSIKYIKKF